MQFPLEWDWRWPRPVLGQATHEFLHAKEKGHHDRTPSEDMAIGVLNVTETEFKQPDCKGDAIIASPNDLYFFAISGKPVVNTI